jgi:deoxycytidylate deaminase
VTSGIPCADCARGIINSGIKRVYCKKECTTKNREKWEESQNRTLEMFEECGVEVVYY